MYLRKTLNVIDWPFYSCLLGDLACEWQRGCRRPRIDTDRTAFIMQNVTLCSNANWSLFT